MDVNSDGQINDGSELFGPTSGHGFQELSDLDSDGNLWIDENDAIYDKLLIWNPETENSLISMREAGVGAISITHAKSPFLLEDSVGKTLGQVKESGIFLSEDGNVRSIQEIDLAVRSEDADDFSTGNENRMLAGDMFDAVTSMRQLIRLQQVKARLYLLSLRLRREKAAEDQYDRILHELWRQNDNLSLDPASNEKVEKQILRQATFQDVLTNLTERQDNLLSSTPSTLIG